MHQLRHAACKLLAMFASLRSGIVHDARILPCQPKSTDSKSLARERLLVWLVLYRDTRNGIAQTSQADIARRTRLSSRTVRYAIGRLTKRGLLALVYRGGINRGTSKYRVSPNLNGGLLRQQLLPTCCGKFGALTAAIAVAYFP